MNLDALTERFRADQNRTAGLGGADIAAAAERLLLERAAVFDGGWTLEGAEAVCSGDGIEPDTVLDLLAGLASKSLVLVETRGAAARYRMLETIRQFAYEKLADSGDVERVRRRHLDFYVALATEAEPQLKRREQAEKDATP